MAITYGIAYPAPILSQSFNSADFSNAPAAVTAKTTTYMTNADITGTLSVGGVTTLSDTSVAGGLTVSGNFSAGGTAIGGNVTVTGNANVTGNVYTTYVEAGSGYFSQAGTGVAVAHDVTVGGTLSVTGAATTGALSCTTCSASGLATFNAGASIPTGQSLTCDSITSDATHDLTISGVSGHDIIVNTASGRTGYLKNNGSTALSFTGTNVSIPAGTLTVTGAATTGALSCTAFHATSTGQVDGIFTCGPIIGNSSSTVNGTSTVNLGPSSANQSYIDIDAENFASNGVYDHLQTVYTADSTNTTNTNNFQHRRVKNAQASEYVQYGPADVIYLGSYGSSAHTNVLTVNCQTQNSTFSGDVACNAINATGKIDASSFPIQTTYVPTLGKDMINKTYLDSIVTSGGSISSMVFGSGYVTYTQSKLVGSWSKIGKMVMLEANFNVTYTYSGTNTTAPILLSSFPNSGVLPPMPTDSEAPYGDQALGGSVIISSATDFTTIPGTLGAPLITTPVYSVFVNSNAISLYTFTSGVSRTVFADANMPVGGLAKVHVNMFWAAAT